MSDSARSAFKEYVWQLLAEHKGERVYHFTYQKQAYWLKQPEQLRGVWRLLKPHPKQSFLNEIHSLQHFAERQAPVPKLMMFGEDYLVLEDGGHNVAYWVSRNIDNQTKQQILCDAAKALADLHRRGLVHGRPAIRDILWKDGNVLFIYNLCREQHLSDELICNVMRKYQAYCDPQEWDDMMHTVCHYRFIYYLLLPFKYIAKKDLIGIYRLFKNVDLVKKGK